MESAEKSVRARRALNILLAAVLIGGFGWGLVRLFRLRFESGDMYPPYSSLRSDPLGTRVLYEALEILPDVAVSRNFGPLDRLDGDDGPPTIAVVGLGPFEFRWMTGDDSRDLQQAALRGATVIISLVPEGYYDTWAEDEEEDDDEDDTEETKTNEVSQCSVTNGCATCKSSRQRVKWDLEIGRIEEPEDGLLRAAVAVESSAYPPMPPEIPWAGNLYFTAMSNGWRTLYTSGTNAVVVTKRYGEGRFVLLADSYLLSNEAMWRDRSPDLLAWLMGRHRRIVFDETHFGIARQPGIAALMRKYRLHGFIGAILLLAVLFVWMESSPLIPRVTAKAEAKMDIVLGRDSTSGLVNLLKRQVRVRELLQRSVEIWEKTAGAGIPQERRRAVAAIAARASDKEAPDPSETYRKICRKLKERKT